MTLPVTNRTVRPLPGPYRTLASLFGAATAALGFLGLLGWLGLPLLASVRSSYIPMAPLTSIAFVCLGGLLLVHSMGPSQGPVGILAVVLSTLLSAYGLIELVEYLGIPVLSLEEWLFPEPPMLGAIPTARMSPATAALVLLSGAVVPMFHLRERGGERHKLFGDLAGCLGVLVAMAGAGIVMSYLHGTPLLYGTLAIPMAATTALAFLSLGTGQVFAAGPESFPSRSFAGPSARARLLRVFVSTTVGVVVTIDLMHVYTGWIFFKENAFMSGISTTAFAVMTGALIARVALKVGNDMDRSEEVRKRTEETLRESEERFRVLSEQSPLGIALIDRQGRYEYVNPAFVSIFGYALNEVPTGADWFRAAFPDPDARREVIRAWKEDLASSGVGEARPRDFDVTCKGGARKCIRFLPVSLSLDRQFVIYEDVTRQRVLQAQLQQAMKMEAVGSLAGGVAHDFNNLLTVIIGNVTLALMKLAPSDPAGGLLAEANKAAERAAALTQQLLAFSRKQIIEPKVLDLNVLIADLSKMLVRLIGENIDLKTVPGEDLGLVKADAGQFEQVMVNLTVNARDAMPNGGRIVIETSNAELDDGYCSRHPYVKPGRFVMVAVSDTGNGMSEEVKAQIFEPFFTTKAKGRGTGLGLATTYGAMKQAGGSIEVYSEVGIGTTFKIYLPRVEGEASKAVRDDPSRELSGGSETVLLVEDEEIVRNLCVRILERSGYRVMQAGSGDAALALATGFEGRIDLLMTDVVMPGIHGRELANRLSRIHPETRVLFTSGYTDNAIVHHGVMDEGVSFIGKPYTPSGLARKVREVLDEASRKGGTPDR